MTDPPQNVGPYRIETPLGVGELGMVYQGYDEQLQRKVALKRAVTRDDGERDRFRHGARAIARLNHPSLVQIHSFVDDGEGDWIVMEFIEGEILAALIEDGPLDPVQALPLAREVAEGLAVAHEHGIVFLSLRTEGVMVTESGHAKILDFGLARLIEQRHTKNPITEEGQLHLAFRAMAPEQVLDQPVDERSDLFSLGTLLYETVTGISPFAGSTDVQILQRICTHPQEGARELNPKVPAALSRLIDRLLQKKPDARPQTAREVIAELGKIHASSAADPTPPLASFEDTTPGPYNDGTSDTSSQMISIKTLLLIDLVDSTRLVEELGDRRAAEILALHDRLARDLLAHHEGREIDKTDGFLLVFKRPVDAVLYAMRYHGALERLSEEVELAIRARAGIHLGEVILRENTPQDVLRGAKPLEVEGLAKPIAARVMSLAGGGQTLLTRGAFDLSRRAISEGDEEPGRGLRWLSHGKYAFKGVADDLEVFEVGLEGSAPLSPPAGSDKARRIVDQPPAAATHRRSLPRLIAGLAAALLLAVLARLVPLPFFSSTLDATARPSLAVLGFRNLSGREDLTWVSTALAEAFSTELATGGDLRLIPGESIARMKHELELSDAETLSVETLEAIDANLGTDYVLLGSYLPVGNQDGDQLRLLLRLQSTSDDSLEALSQTGRTSDLFELVSRAGGSLRRKLDLDALSATELEEVRATLSPSPEANRLYSQGLAKLRDREALAARDLLLEAVTTDPGHARAHAALSEAWLTLGFDDKALASAGEAFARTEGLPREESLLIQGRYYEAASQWQNALDTYRELWRLGPGNIDYGLRLAAAQISADRGREALATVAELRRLPPPAGDDPRIGLAAAGAAFTLSDYQGMLDAAREAETKGTARLARILVGEALRLQGRALLQLGRNDAAAEALAEARTLFTEIGDRAKLAQVLRPIAILAKFEGDLSEAEALYRQALDIHRQTGNRSETSSMLNNLALLNLERGDLETGRRRLEEALRIAREDGRRLDEGDFLQALAELVLAQGEVAQARQLASEALTIHRGIASREGEAWALDALGKVALAAGEVAEARGYFEQARQISDDIGYRHLAANVRSGLGEVLLLEGDLEAAMLILEQALTIRAELGERGTSAETQGLRARLFLELGRAVEAAILMREAAAEFAREERRDHEITANAMLAQALLGQGDSAGARAAANRARQRAEESQSPAARLAADLAEARVLAASGEPAGAGRRLAAVRREAARLGLAGLELEARFFLAQIDLASGSGDGRGKLAALAEEASEKGFALLARKASEAGAA